MISRRTSFVVGLILVGLGSWAVLGQDTYDRLCIDKHPVRRSLHVTYGGKPPVHGMRRDHIIPLGLGGPDTADNVQYQTPIDAESKDRTEWMAIEAYCRGEMTLAGARAFVQSWRP